MVIVNSPKSSFCMIAGPLDHNSPHKYGNAIVIQICILCKTRSNDGLGATIKGSDHLMYMFIIVEYIPNTYIFMDTQHHYKKNYSQPKCGQSFSIFIALLVATNIGIFYVLIFLKCSVEESNLARATYKTRGRKHK